MELENAIAAWVDGDPDLLAQAAAGEDLYSGMLEQECMAQALAALYDAGQASARIRSAVLAELLASEPEAARVTIEQEVQPEPLRRQPVSKKAVWIGFWLAAATCVAVVLLTRLAPPAVHYPPHEIAPATATASPPCPTPEPLLVESLPPPEEPAQTEPTIPAAPPALAEATPPPLPRLPSPAVPEIAASSETSIPATAATAATAAATPPPVATVAQAAPARDPLARPFADASLWNLPLPPTTKLASARLVGREKNLRIGLRWQPVFVSELPMPERELWVDDERLGALRLPAAANLQMFRQTPLILVAPDGLTAWVVVEPRPMGEGRIGATSARLVDLTASGDGPPDQPLIAGIIRQDELTSGIFHALSIGLPPFLTKSKCRVGSRIAIPQDVDPDDFGAAREIARALRDYGGFVTYESKSDAVEILFAGRTPPAVADALPQLLKHLHKAQVPDSR